MAKIARLNQRLSADHTGLVLFDTLNGYLHPFNDPAKDAFLKAHNILPNLERLLSGARAAGLTVFYPAGAHAPEGADSVDRLTDTDMNLGRAAAPEHPHTSPFPRRLESGRDRARTGAARERCGGAETTLERVFQTNLDLQLRVRGIDTIVIAGGSTDVGIASTLFAARRSGLRNRRDPRCVLFDTREQQ